MAFDRDTPKLTELRRAYMTGRDPLAYIPFATELMNEKKFSQALDVCLRGIGQRPTLSARRLLANIYFSMGRYDEALRALDDLLREAPDSFAGNMLRAKTLARRGLWSEAGEALEKLLEIAPFDPEVKRLETQVHEESERARKATMADIQTPSDQGEYQTLVKERLSEQEGVGFCFFQKPQEGNVLEQHAMEDYFGLILHQSIRIAEALGMGEFDGMMIEYESGYVLASRATDDFLITQFKSDVAPASMRRTVSKYLALKP